MVAFTRVQGRAACVAELPAVAVSLNALRVTSELGPETSSYRSFVPSTKSQQSMVCCWVRTKPDGDEGKRHLKVEASKVQVWFWDSIKRSRAGRLALLGSSAGVLRETCWEPAQLPSLSSAHIAAAEDHVCPGCRQG